MDKRLAARIYRCAAALLGTVDTSGIGHEGSIDVCCWAILVAVHETYPSMVVQVQVRDLFTKYFKPEGAGIFSCWFGYRHDPENLETRRLALLLMADIVENLP